MEPDDLLPNSGDYFGVPLEPLEQTIARKKEQAKTLEGLDVLKEVVARMDERIIFYGSIDAMPDEVKADPEKFMHWHNANQLTRTSLQAEKEWITSLIDAYARNKL